MQHIKLFEEFIQTKYYKQIKELPERGQMLVDAEESEALQKALYANNYKWSSGVSRETLPFEKHKENERLKLEVGWYTIGNPAIIHPDKHKRISADTALIKNLKALDFDEYFNTEDYYRGHHAGKKYGI